MPQNSSVEYIYRLATRDDLADIVLLDQIANPHPWGETLVTQSFDQPQKRINILVLNQDQTLCGWLTASRLFDESELELIMVAPQARRQGLAQGLIQAWLTSIKPIPVHLCMLEVRESNQAALALYQKIGFAQVGLRKNYYVTKSGKEAAILMNLNLRKD